MTIISNYLATTVCRRYHDIVNNRDKLKANNHHPSLPTNSNLTIARVSLVHTRKFSKTTYELDATA